MSGYSETFSRTYLVSFNAYASRITVGPPLSGGGRTYSDTCDAAENGRTPDSVLVQNGTRTETYIGQLPGTGIVTLHGGSYYLSTNDARPLTGQVLPLERSIQALGLLPGCLIETPQGEIAVEMLTPGDMVSTADGRQVRVRWIGRQTIHTGLDISDRLHPIRFAAGSLGNGFPDRDLRVCPNHGILIDEVICQAGALVNGVTISRLPLARADRSYIAYHVETEAHEIILANGAAAETFIDNVSRKGFDNYAEFMALYPNAPDMAELDYPRAMSARQVPPRIRDLLAPPKVA